MAKHGRPGWMLAAPRTGARLGGLFLLLTVLASCSGDGGAGSDGPLVKLHLSPVDPAATHADLSIQALDATGQPVPRMTTFASGPFDQLGIGFPSGTRGGTTYQVNLYSEPSCLLATGQAALMLDSDVVFDVAVTMTAVPLCGNGATVTVQVVDGFGGSGTVTSTPAGISCTGTSTTGCSATFMKGTAVTLSAQSSAGAFAGWSGANCPGLGSCPLTLSQDVQIQAVFTTCHGWCKEPLPSGVSGNLNGVAGTAVNNVLIVGDAGMAVRWDGTSWTKIPPQGTSVALRAVAAKANGSIINVAGDMGTILQLTGTTWKTIPGAGPDNLRALAIGPGTMPATYFVGDKGTSFVLPNNGTAVTAWNSKTTLPLYTISQNPNGGGVDLYMGGAPNPTQGFAQSWDGKNAYLIQASGSGGGSSIPGNINAMLCGLGFHYAAGDGGLIIRRASGGNNAANWMLSSSAQTTQSLRGMWSSGDNNIIAVGDAGTIVQFDGTNWTKATTGVVTNLRAVWGSGPNNIYAVGDNGIVLHYLP